LTALLQSLRLYNRAVDTLARLHPVPASRHVSQDDDPFAAPEPQDTKKLQPQLKPRKTSMNGLEWRISDGLLTVLFALAQAYFARGSAREAAYFAQQAQDLAESIQTPAMVSRALARKGEIYLYLGQLDEGYQCIVQAADLVSGMSATDAADIRRLHGDYSRRNLNNQDAKHLYGQAMTMLEELQKLFIALDGVSPASVISFWA
jgi:separase